MRKVLGIDPGLSCGWALREADGRMISGVWNLKGNRFEGAGMRIIRLRQCLAAFSDVEMVAFEEVRRHMGVDAAHLYGAITHELMAWCEASKIPYQGVPVATVKKRATGKGNADKDAMVAAARGRWPEWGADVVARPGLEDESDARWIAETAASSLVA